MPVLPEQQLGFPPGQLGVGVAQPEAVGIDESGVFIAEKICLDHPFHPGAKGIGRGDGAGQPRLDGEKVQAGSGLDVPVVGVGLRFGRVQQEMTLAQGRSPASRRQYANIISSPSFGQRINLWSCSVFIAHQLDEKKKSRQDIFLTAFENR